MDAPPTPVPLPAPNLPAVAGIHAPALFAADPAAEKRSWEFFTVTIRNRNTRMAYLRAAARFGDWCGDRGLALGDVEPMAVAAYIEELTRALGPASVKQHLAAMRMLFDWLVLGHVGLVPQNDGDGRGRPALGWRGRMPSASSRRDTAFILRPSRT